MKTVEYLTTIVNELQNSVPLISEQDAEKLADEILNAKQIFVVGAGRSGMMGKAFAMRMMHMGFDAYVIGETVTPTYTEDDLLIVCTGSGETNTLIPITQKAKKLGGKVAAVTLSPDSSIGKLADLIVQLPGAPKDQDQGEYKTIQPMGSLFEQIMLLFFDATILRIMEKRGLDTNKMYGKHANLE
ncbi:6-phospho-3-hexuloisomerase [Ligilactobacillus ceti]|uniref:Sugar isomerase (Sis) n=1 Tax=Ligilactobacillus ceti DSM 22408 TaxID=1122146 RepID=A0A0R2KHI7_9LACO|nr:6-phospho-3-hexuloisomerase [Ligilactobacillus ceti]KRN88851.1 sugar isomerase (sis) [Ligilactobacillus ceti DSM 22408]